MSNLEEKENVDSTEESPVILSLCTGFLRGLEVGIERALQRSITVAAYCEIEVFAIENLLCGMEKNILVPAPIWSDLKTFPFSSFHGKIHGIIGGYPCQPFSSAGKRNGENDPRHLWPFICEGVRAARPLFCFFENVEGHLSLGFEEVSRDLRNMGYRVEAGLFSAEEVGAPHRRKRLFILALADSASMRDIRGLFGLAGPNENIETQKKQRKNERGKLKHASYKMANTCGKPVWNRSRRLYNAATFTGIELANNNNTGLQGLRECGGPKGWKIQAGYIRGGRFVWPVRPGEPQNEDEPPRIESRMGYNVNGYNFREDLLRGIGNGVVWQTAELAFKTLMNNL